MDIIIEKQDDPLFIGGATQDGEGSGQTFVNEGPGNYFLDVFASGVDYEIVVEDCTGEDGQQPPGGGTVDDDVASGVDPSTIPDKKLPNTGGVPLTGLLLIGGVGSVVAGSLLRVTLGRSRR